MRRYYGRFWTTFRKDFAAATGEQVIGALLVIGILIFQIRYGIIRPGEIGANFWAIAWPYLLLVTGLFLRHIVRTPYTLDQDRQKEEDRLKGETVKNANEIARLTQKPDIRGEILAAFWDFPKNYLGAPIFGDSQYFLRLRLTNHNDVPCTIRTVILYAEPYFKGNMAACAEAAQLPMGVLEHNTTYRDTADLPPNFSPEIMRLSPVFVRLHQRCS